MIHKIWTVTFFASFLISYSVLGGDGGEVVSDVGVDEDVGIGLVPPLLEQAVTNTISKVEVMVIIFMGLF